jgi:1-acyl-sn-glycerol-3-phosphate acyltransferase
MIPGSARRPTSLALSGPGDPVARGAETAPTRRPDGRDAFPPLYRVLRLGCATLLRRYFDLRVTGIEHLPASGPFIVAANHHNYIDGVVLGVALPRPIAFVVMPQVYRASPLHPLFHRRIGSIPVSLERPDPGALRRVLRALLMGRVIGIFPEGPFSRDGHLVTGQPGVAMIALRSGTPVVPAAIVGTYEALRGRRFHVPRRHPLAVRFGPPIHLDRPRHRRATRTEREDATCRIMAEIAALLGVDGRPGAADRASRS